MRNVLHPFKWSLAVILVGFLARTFGVLIKVMHWRGADSVLITGTAMMIAGIVWLLIKILLLKKTVR